MSRISTHYAFSFTIEHIKGKREARELVCLTLKEGANAIQQWADQGARPIVGKIELISKELITLEIIKDWAPNLVKHLAP